MIEENTVTMEELVSSTQEALESRGVSIEDIGQIVMELQGPYIENLSLEMCENAVNKVINKREVCHAVLTGIAIDELAEKDLLPEPIDEIIKTDDKLYGIDEIIPLSIVNLHGSIGLTNFGYLDRVKPGIIDELDSNKIDGVNTFLDDIIAAIAASAASRLAHNSRE